MKSIARERTLLKQRLAKAVADPRLAVDEGWHQDSAFLQAFFDRAEDEMLHLGSRSFDLALRAVELACRNGDPCRVHQAHGLLSHAHIVRGDLFWAGKTLEDHRQETLECCPPCRSRFFRREGDLLGEERRVPESLVAFNRSLEEGEGHLEDDDYGRLYYLRGISHHFDGQRDRALADAGAVLRLLSLDSPKGFFADAIAFLAVFVVGGDTGHDQLALDHTRAFSERVRGLDGWKPVHTRRFWAQGHFHARLGDVRRSDANLERALNRLFADGLDREVVAAALDRAQLRCRGSWVRDDNLRTAKSTIGRLVRQRPGLAEDHRRRLAEIENVLQKSPEDAFQEIGAVRRSFVAPIPGRLGERIGPE